MSALKDWYQEQSPRDKRILQVGGAVLAFALVYALVWKPFNTRLIANRLAVETSRSTLAELRQLAPELAARRGSGSGSLPAGMSLPQAVNQVAGEFQLNLSRWQPDGDDKVQLWLDDASFDSLVTWLGALNSRYGIRIDSINISRGEAPGQVKVRVALQGGR